MNTASTITRLMAMRRGWSLGGHAALAEAMLLCHARSRAIFARCVQKTKRPPAECSPRTSASDASGDARAAAGSMTAADERAERHVAAGEQHDGEDDEREQQSESAPARGTRRPPSRRPCRPCRTEKNRPHVADDRRHAADNRTRSSGRDRACRLATPGAARARTGTRALRHVEQRRRQCRAVCRARERRSSRRGCPIHACADRCPRESPREVRRGNRPEEIRATMTAANGLVHAGLATHHDAQRIAGESPERRESRCGDSGRSAPARDRDVAEHGDRRRLRLDLRRVVELDLAARGLRRLAAREQLLQLLVHLGGGDALARSASTSRMTSSTRVTRWPVSADVKRNGTNSRKGAFSAHSFSILARLPCRPSLRGPIC